MAEVHQFRGAMLAAACGDALGYPLDKLQVVRIMRLYGPFGLRTPVRTKKSCFLAPVSAVTQTMLAAADGIFWADAKRLSWTEGIYRGLMRWFYCQTGEEPRHGQRTWMRRQPHEREFCLVREKFMHAHRSPGDTGLAALENDEQGSIKNRVNEAKNSEPLVRSGPVGLLYAGRPRDAFYEAVRAAVLTHSQPETYLSAASAAYLASSLAGGMSLPKSLEGLLTHLATMEHTEPIVAALTAAIQQANEYPAGTAPVWGHLDGIRSFGTGETAPAALAIAVYCVMACDDPFEAILTAANHDGKSSVTAALTGFLEGVRFGEDFLPASWLDSLEGREVIGNTGEKLFATHEKTMKSE